MRIEITDAATYASPHPQGSLCVYGGVGITKNLIIGDTTNSSDQYTGATVVYGGVGIAKDLYVGGAIYSSSNVLSSNNWFCIYFTNTVWGTNSITVTLKSSDNSTVVMHYNGTEFDSNFISYNISTSGQIIVYDTFNLTDYKYYDNTSPIPTDDVAMSTYSVISQTFTPSDEMYLTSIYFPDITYDADPGGLIIPTFSLEIRDNLNNLMYSTSLPIKVSVLPRVISPLSCNICGNVKLLLSTQYKIIINYVAYNVNVKKVTPLISIGSYTINGNTVTDDALSFKIGYVLSSATKTGIQVLAKSRTVGSQYSICTSIQSSNINIFEVTTSNAYSSILLGDPKYDTDLANKIFSINDVVKITDTTDSGATNNGSLIIAGGVGIAKSLHVGAGIYLPTTGGTSAMINYYETTQISGNWIYDTGLTTSYINCVIFGNNNDKIITLNIRTSGIITGGTTVGVITLETALSSDICPNDEKNIPTYILDGTVLVLGLMCIETNGAISIYANSDKSTSFTNTTVTVLSTSVTYILHS